MTKETGKYLRTVSIQEVKKEIGRSKTPTHISLFTGVGGFDIGFSLAGFESRVMVEWNKDCCKTLRANWLWEELKKRPDLKGKPIWKNKEEMKKQIGHYKDREPVILEKDITKVTTEEILKAGNLKVGEATAITGGVPCQGFSTIGKRMIDDPRNALFKEFVRIVGEALPLLFVFENVPGLVSMKKGDIIKQICEEFANKGYDINWDILNAADYGVPQNRRRVFIFGYRVDLARITEEGRMQLHMGAIPGTINHPAKFRKKQGMTPKGQFTLNDYKQPTSIIEMLQQLRRRSEQNAIKHENDAVRTRRRKTSATKPL